MICPLKIDMYCNNNTETALHAAIKGKHYDLVFALLKAGGSVNTVIKAYHDINEVSFSKLITNIFLIREFIVRFLKCSL